jgi:hypothetical protein
MRRIARRVEDILEAARDRETKGQSLALDIDARFRLQDLGAVQFQLASAILEEMGGLRQEEVVSELLALGLSTVLRGAARAAAGGDVASSLMEADKELDPPQDEALMNVFSAPMVVNMARVVN